MFFKVNLLTNMSLIIDDNFHAEIPEKEGVYKIICLDNKQFPKHIPRATGVDIEGILYIGTSINLNKRLTDFKKGLLPTYESNPHIAARRYLKISSLVKEYHYQNMIAEFVVTKDHKIKERETIDNYIAKFGEAPPLNSY